MGERKSIHTEETGRRDWTERRFGGDLWDIWRLFGRHTLLREQFLLLCFTIIFTLRYCTKPNIHDFG